MREKRSDHSPPPSTEGAHSFVLVRRLVRDFIWRHWRRIVLAFLCMGNCRRQHGGARLADGAGARPGLYRQATRRCCCFLAGAALVLALVKGVADYGQAILMTRVGQRVITDVQTALYTRLIRADLAYFNANPSGMLISRLINDVGLLRNAAANVLAGIGRDAVTVGIPGRASCSTRIGFWRWSRSSRFRWRSSPIVKIGRRMRRVSANTQAEHGAADDAAEPDLPGRAASSKPMAWRITRRARAPALFERIYRAGRPRQPHPLARRAA